LAALTPFFAGVLVMLYITFESPISGMSMNPARTVGSAFWAHAWTGLWIYLTAPPLAMLAASQAYLTLPGVRRVYCAKLHHLNSRRCIFNCAFHEMIEQSAGANCEAQLRKPNALDAHLNHRTLFYG
jgi:aquaporin Z